MFKNYITVALRNIIKQKTHLAINLFGLTIGLMGFVLANIFADYEESYDTFFKDFERIHVVYSKIDPASGFGVPEINGVNSAFAPVYRAENPDAVIARYYAREIVVGQGELQFYQDVQFIDPEFLDIFVFEAVDGNLKDALRRPNTAIMTEQAAARFFGNEPAVGKVLTFSSKADVEVIAVIRNLPANSHFSFSIIEDTKLGILASTQTLTQISNETIEGTWFDLSTSDRTYIKLAEGETKAGVSDKVDVVYQRHADEKRKEFISNLFLRPVKEANLLIWQVTGIPGMAVLRILGGLILVVAVINFINLATAQAMGRAREVGIRKTLGARPRQLIAQFLTEAVVVTLLAMFLALAMIEYLVPVINQALDKSVTFSPFTDLGTLVFLVSTALVVGLLSGSYPAFLLARLPSSTALSAEMKTGKRAGLLRRALVVTQFGVSVFLVVSGLVIYAQNSHMRDQDYGFHHEDMIVIQRMNQDGIKESYTALKDEIARLPSVASVAGSSQVPFEQNHHRRGFWKDGGVAEDSVGMNMKYVDLEYLDTYGLKLLEGRNFRADIPNDLLIDPEEEGGEMQGSVNIIMNALAARRLGFDPPAMALGQTLLSDWFEGQASYTIVGVMEDTDFLGFFNDMKPWVFVQRPAAFSHLTIRPTTGNVEAAVAEIDQVWSRIIPDYPIQRTSVDELFDALFKIFQGMNTAVAGFAGLALLVACAGLFGLSAFVAETRTKEIGIRKVMGATTSQIAQLLVWQFSKPVFLANLLAWPLAYLAMQQYLNFFADRIGEGAGFLIFFMVAGIFSLILAALTVGSHALRIARRTPVMALRYE